MLFADIIGCSEISNHKSLAAYNKFLDQFHAIFDEVTEEHKKTWYAPQDQPYFKAGVRGDEGCLMIFIPGRDEAGLAQDVDTAVNVGLDLKRRWLLSDDNRERIEGPALLPTELAVGIHVGRAYVNADVDGGFRPEGYAINLTKRIESASRTGQFTHVFLSEAARGQLEVLTDEITYWFGPPRIIQAKGISRDITAFEVKHHFLPSDWGDPREGYQTTRALDFEPTSEQVELAMRAHHENPTNLWLAEEFLMLKLQYEYDRLELAGKEEHIPSLRKAYEDAIRVARRLTSSEQKDALSLVIRGRIAGECFDYPEEQRLYRDAQRLDPQLADAYWHEALSMSDELYDEIGPPFAQPQTEPENERVNKVRELFRRAVELEPRHSWMRFDLACELARWATRKQDRDEATEELVRAHDLNPVVARYIVGNEYLSEIASDPKIKRILPRQ